MIYVDSSGQILKTTASVRFLQKQLDQIQSYIKIIDAVDLHANYPFFTTDNGKISYITPGTILTIK